MVWRPNLLGLGPRKHCWLVLLTGYLLLIVQRPSGVKDFSDAAAWGAAEGNPQRVAVEIAEAIKCFHACGAPMHQH
jgi:hypothetical protein